MDVNALVHKVTGGAQGAHGTLSTLMGMMGGQDHAGFSNMLSSLASSGLADQAKSWVSTGANRVVDGQQVASWLSPDKLQQLAQATGLSPSEAADHLARQLPTVVDKLTPRGAVPDQSGLQNTAGRLIGQ